MIAPFDLQSILVNHLAGSMQVFIFLSFIAIAALAARFRMSTGVSLLSFVIFTLCLSVAVPDILFLTIILGGMFIVYGIIKMFKF